MVRRVDLRRPPVKRQKPVNKKRRVRLPTSGSEHPFSVYPWGYRGGGSNSNNCYAYAMHDWESYRVHKAQPGNRSGMSNRPIEYRSCERVHKRVLSDNPRKVRPAPLSRKCPRGYYKVVLVIAPGRDFHWYKQHSVVYYRVKAGDTRASLARFFKVPVSRFRGLDLTPGKMIRFKANVWSHKRGWGGEPLLVDAKGKAILNPLTAARNYGWGLNYSKFCGSYCVKRTGVNVGKTRSKIF